MTVVDHLQTVTLFELSSLYWFSCVHFDFYKHEILMIDSIRANSVLLIELEVFSWTYCEAMIKLQFFRSLQGTMLRTEHFQYRNIHFLAYFSLCLVKLYWSSVGSFIVVDSSAPSFMYIFKNQAISTRINTCICALVKTIVPRKIKNLSLSERILRKLMHYSLNYDSCNEFFLIFSL